MATIIGFLYNPPISSKRVKWTPTIIHMMELKWSDR